MGIPGLRNWLIKKYPDIVTDVKDKPSTNTAKQNSTECDNLYLDMNQIIHQCAHSENDHFTKTEDKIIKMVFDYITEIFSTVHPRRLLYMAMDGVPPSARIPHQRSNAFRKAQKNLPQAEYFNACSIKPGTEFMVKLSGYLQDYINERMNHNPAWQSIKVILSDSNVPGEGEHKIINFIRQQRAQPGYIRDTRDVIYGSDSDLILLGLTVHEPFLKIICEVCANCGEMDHTAKECTRKKNTQVAVQLCTNWETKYVFIDLEKLHQKLINDLKINRPLGFQLDDKRMIADWTFMCFLGGNDFFPNIPSILFYEYVMEDLMSIYKEIVLKAGHYLTNNVTPNMECVKSFLKCVAEKEEETFQKRRATSLPRKDQAPAKPSIDIDKIKEENTKPSPIRFGPALRASRPNQQEQAAPKEVDNDLNDTVRLWENGWRERYYKANFKINEEQVETFRAEVVEHYFEGLCWILQYYYKGVPSWDWFYRHHYAPFASDFVTLRNIGVHFMEESEPLKPLELLMAIFPPQYAKYLPIEWQPLMLDKDSPLVRFYPWSIDIDLNGKFKEWQSVALLSPMDKQLLLQALALVDSELTQEEEKRNRVDYDRLFIHSTHLYYRQFKGLYDSDEANEVTKSKPLQISTQLSEGMTGLIWPDDGDHVKKIGAQISLPKVIFGEEIKNNQVLSVKCRNLPTADVSH